MNEQTRDTEGIERTNKRSPRRGDRSLSRRGVVRVAAGACAFVAVGGTVTAQENETVTVQVDLADDEIEPGETTEATVTISEIPNGISGILGNASVTDSSVAEITGASFPDEWGLTQEPEIDSNGSSSKLVTADIERNYTAGDTDVELVTLELEAVGDGETEIDLENLVEDAEGNLYDFELESQTLSAGDGGSSSVPGFGAGAAIAGLTGGIAYLLRDRSGGSDGTR